MLSWLISWAFWQPICITWPSITDVRCDLSSRSASSTHTTFLQYKIHKWWVFTGRCGWVMQPYTHKRTQLDVDLHADTERTAPTSADSFTGTVISPGHLLCCPYLDLAKLLCRPIYIFAARQGRAQKCRGNLSRIAPRCRLLRQRVWTNRGVGRVKHYWYQWHVHGCDKI